MTGPTVKSLLLSALAVVATSAAGAALGLSGVLSAPTESTGVAFGDGRTVPASACVDGPVIASIPAGSRVVAVARSDDGGWTGVRTASSSGVVWVPLAVVTLDEGEPDAASLPIGGACSEVSISAPAPTPEPTEPPAPGPTSTPNPGPAPDTTAPSLSMPNVNPALIQDCPAGTTVSATASDDRGVVRVSIIWSGVLGGSADMTLSSGVWRHQLSANGSDDGQIVFQLIAHDAAGNQSPQRAAVATVECFG